MHDLLTLMTPTPLEIALERIDECRRTRSTELDLSKLGLEELPVQVVACHWLNTLDISSNNIKNINHLEKLNQIIRLECAHNNISELSPISEMKSLSWLNINNNKINNIIAIQNCKKIQVLECENNNISSIAPISNLVELKFLNCASNKIKKYTALESLVSLDGLVVGYDPDIYQRHKKLGNDFCFPLLYERIFLNLTNIKNLKGLMIKRGNFFDVNLNNPPNLKSIEFFGVSSFNVKIDKSIPVDSFDIRESYIRKLDLKFLPKLKFFACRESTIYSLTLEDLPSLSSIHIGYNQQIKRLSIKKLFNKISRFFCGGNYINFFSIEEIKNLEQLMIRNNTCIKELVIRNLPKTKTIDSTSNATESLTIDNVPKLINITFPENELGNLESLKMIKTLEYIAAENNKINNLAPIKNLRNLKALFLAHNEISDISDLHSLSKLEHFWCHANKISDISPLEKLKNLNDIDISSNQIVDISSLSKLGKLRKLNCENNKIKDLSPLKSLVISETLKHIWYSGNPLYTLPPVLSIYSHDAEILSKQIFPYGNGLIDNIRNYWTDLAKGSYSQIQAKIQLLGNGRTGKTTLAYVLKNKLPPSEDFESTHGIVIQEIEMPLNNKGKPAICQLWDFGGQEIYHATHRLFLSNDCIYLLLWSEETNENFDETCHPLSYWLESIHDLAPKSSVILVKNQIDKSDLLPIRPHYLAEDTPGAKQIKQEIKISALQYRGINTLLGSIKDMLADLEHHLYIELPASWIMVQNKLKKLNQKTILFAHFKQLCIAHGINHAEWFAYYLNQIGVFFYHEKLFQNQIIIDQNWMVNAIYRLFDPNKPHRSRIERMRGKFSGEDVSLFWSDEEIKEPEIYIYFMLRCSICYEKKQHDKPFTEREFIIPALLPLTSKAKAAWGNSHLDDWQLDIEYPFLHRSIIERIILRLGETYDGEPWRTGIFCHTDEGQLLLECEYTNKQHSTQGRLRFQLRGSQLERLVYALRKLVSETSPHRRYHEFLSKTGAERIQLPEFRDEEKEHSSRLDTSKPADKTIKLFISYSHADEDHKIRLEKHLKAISRTLPLVAWSDRFLFSGEAVDEQIFQQLDTADIVLLLVSPDFINSDYCFTKEMVRALERYEKAGNVVIPVIVRHTPSWRDHDIGQIAALPKDGKPLAKWADADEFWGSVEDGIREQVKKLMKT